MSSTKKSSCPINFFSYFLINNIYNKDYLNFIKKYLQMFKMYAILRTELEVAWIRR